ncbi:MAG: hypothetical protein ABIH42_06505 [Planctomycetota bacterium]
MLRIIEEKSEIAKLNSILKDQLDKVSNKKVRAVLGFKHTSFPTTISVIDRLNYWHLSGKQENRFTNLFGVGSPSKGQAVNVVTEINIPFKGIDRRIGGAFAADKNRNVYLVHRGKIGGGRTGIGKKVFLRNYIGKLTPVEDGERVSRVAPIGKLKSIKLPIQIKGFIDEVNRIKNLSISEPQKLIPSKTYGFSEEYSKIRQYKVSTNIETSCDHAVIVNELSKKLKALGYQIGNDQCRDLFILNNKKQISVVFEVKSDVSTTNTYTAIGQLLLNNVDLKNKPDLFFVNSEDIPEDLIKKLLKLGIKTLKYVWKDDTIIFNELNKLKMM